MSIGLAGVEVYIEDEEEGRGRVEGLEQEGETTSERRSANDEGDYREKSVGQRRRGEKEREKEYDEKHTGEKGELQLQSRRGRMTTHRHIGFHFHFSRRSIRAPALPLPVHSPSLSLSFGVFAADAVDVDGVPIIPDGVFVANVESGKRQCSSVQSLGRVA